MKRTFELSHLLTGLILSSLMLTACSKQESPMAGSANAEFLDGLYSTRPTVEEPVITILKLQTPALLETAKRENGKLKVDAKLLKAIQAEQEATIAELQKISSDIRVLIRYKYVLNAVTVWAPASALEQIKALPNVTLSEKSAAFSRPVLQGDAKVTAAVGEHTSVNFIGSDAAYAQGIHGEGLRVGIIDTGIDYTHKMLGGEGTEEAYKAVDPSKANAGFPNKKVVGGIDLVGTEYNTASADYRKRIPVPDANPLDEAGHGSHVAGTVAGHGDGINTYDGVAPAADLYAIKVFGAKGSTSDEVVIAALEYAVNPSGDMKFEDQLDVVNLSLGSGYGSAHIMYNQAIKNLTRGGTVVVASGGNSGDVPYIVGAPGVSDDAISVASSVDNTNQNILSPAATFTSSAGSFQAEAIEAAVTKPLSDIEKAEGVLVYAGVADKDFTGELKDKIAGNVALIDRGVVAFADKIKRAQDAGAIAVVVANNADGAPIVMGGEGNFDIPAVMISLDNAKKVKEAMAAAAVSVNLKSGAFVEKAWLIDTISTFSSRGPRSEDGMIKPEIAAPGTNIISAAVGGGAKGTQMSGTSMAGPHIAGVMALLKQKFPTLSPLELKSVLLSHGKIIGDEKKKQYPVARQGAGRVQVAESLKAKVISVPSTVSLGITDIEKTKTLAREITLKNISAEAVTVKAVWTGHKALKVAAPATTLAAGESKTILVTAKIDASQMATANDELDGFLNFATDKENVLQMPVLAVARQISQISASKVVVHSSSAADSAGSLAEVTLQNKGNNPGTAYLFNLIDVDGRKKDSRPDLVHNRNCDMQSAGYRVVEKDGARVLQIAVKLYESMTTWNRCEVNVQIDGNHDGITDQEISGLQQSNLPGLTADSFVSLLLDGSTARELRKKYEADFAADPTKAKEDYSSAVIDMRDMGVFDNSTLAIIEADISALAISDTGELQIKISTTHEDSGAIEYDDYLNNQATEWKKISLEKMGAGYASLPEEITLQGQESVTVPLLKGYGANDLILYAPQNRSVRDVLLEDNQSQVVPSSFEE
ncbi:S8 family serine peptidase [Bdellovibrio sp. NC01]|uniref:S8 family serine peptidase n=1 Tax=Bdellovibrio sp. NC01 TaxID=2220073 RepID=UPI00115734A7|nr:S8 family serine peptidase [Bdellovibrio sp. NC01]QDK37304.1 serine protease [Bdellovibrio sp. NC01]